MARTTTTKKTTKTKATEVTAPGITLVALLKKYNINSAPKSLVLSALVQGNHRPITKQGNFFLFVFKI
jgi:hypothetical protein